MASCYYSLHCYFSMYIASFPGPTQLPSLGVRKSSTGEDLVSFLTLWAASRRVCELGKLVANSRLYLWGLKVTCWLKHWTVDRKVQGSSPTCSRDLFLFWVHSALPQKLSRRFTFVSFGGDIKPSVPGNPLKLA